MKRLRFFVSIFTFVLLSGCCGLKCWNPIIDPTDVNATRFNRDYALCRSLGRQAMHQALRAGGERLLTDAALGAAFGAAFGAVAGNAGAGAAYGALGGVVLSNPHDPAQVFKDVTKACLRHHGYTVY